MKLSQPSSNLVEAIQTLIADQAPVDVRVRCKDHQPSDGLGAHRLILAAASPNYLKEILLDINNTEDELLCLHLPDYTSAQVGPVMSLLYYGETWITESHAQVCQDILQDLKVAVQVDLAQVKREPGLDQDAKKNLKIEQDLKANVKLEPPEYASDTNENESVTVTPGEMIETAELVQVACTEPGCCYKTSSLSSLQSHRLIHGRRKQRLKSKRTCPVCLLILETPKATRDHALEAHSEVLENDNQAHCIADMNCAWTSVLNNDNLSLDFFQHLNDTHLCKDSAKAEDKYLSCDFPGCQYVTQKGFNMTQHIRSHNDERRNECPVCHQRFRVSSHLRDHVKAVHTKERTFQCPHCPRAFATSWQAKSHIRTNHERTKMYKCKQCSKRSFKTPQALAGHVKSSHAKAKPTEKRVKMCEFCGDNLTRNHSCNMDLNKMVECSICQRQMSGKSLKSHLQYHRKKEVSNYLCQFCTKSFTTETSLKRHILIHENAKPHSCQVCEKTLRQKSSLVAHQRIHTGIRFTCDICSKKFITKSLLTKHTNTAHKIS